MLRSNHFGSTMEELRRRPEKLLRPVWGAGACSGLNFVFGKLYMCINNKKSAMGALGEGGEK